MIVPAIFFFIKLRLPYIIVLWTTLMNIRRILVTSVLSKAAVVHQDFITIYAVLVDAVWPSSVLKMQ